MLIDGEWRSNVKVAERNHFHFTEVQRREEHNRSKFMEDVDDRPREGTFPANPLSVEYLVVSYRYADAQSKFSSLVYLSLIFYGYLAAFTLS